MLAQTETKAASDSPSASASTETVAPTSNESAEQVSTSSSASSGGATAKGADTAPAANGGSTTNASTDAGVPTRSDQAGKGAQGGAALGSPCAGAAECASNHCVDGVCCGSANCLECQRCGSNGRCENVEAGATDDVCGVKNMTCNGMGRCAFSLGATCSSSDDCASSHCSGSGKTTNELVCCQQDCGLCANCGVQGSGCLPVSYRGTVGRCDGTNTCVDGMCMRVDKDVLDPDGAVETSVTASAWVAQTWTASASGQLVELRIIGNCEGAMWPEGAKWPTSNRVSIHGVVSGTGAPDNSRVLAKGDDLDLVQRSDSEDDLAVYPIENGPHLVAGDRLAAVFALGDCHFATLERGATGLWTAGDNLVWRSEGAKSLRFMSVVRP